MSVAPIRQLKQQHGFQPYEHDFAYTGSMQEWTVPSTGVYLIELWGANGGTAKAYEHTGNGANGYYVKSYHKLNRGAKYYIGIGGQGTGYNRPWDDSSASHTLSGGYNGGGNGYYANMGNYQGATSGAGGGGTHVSTENATLPNTSSVYNILCAAGGGGGGQIYFDSGYVSDNDANTNSKSNSVLGQGSSSSTGTTANGSGGGGCYGGRNLWSGTCKKSPYSTYTATETAGNNSGNGKAKITRVE